MLKLRIAVLLLICSLPGFAQINLVVKQDGFLFLEGNDSILFYQKSPKDKGGKYSRCHYIHPLYGPDGIRLTEDFPADHLHHRGVFWAWHQILIDNKPVSDGWALENFRQNVSDFEFRLIDGKGCITMVVDWKSAKWKDGAEPYLREETGIIIYPKSGNYRRIDFEIRLKALTDHLSIGGSDDEKGYSGFSVRLKLPDDVVFSDGNKMITPANTSVVAGNAMKIEGSFLNSGKKSGVVIWSDPNNPVPSNSWILRSKSGMQNVAYPGRHPVAIPFHQPLALKYSLLVFKGDMSSTQIRKAIKQ